MAQMSPLRQRMIEDLTIRNLSPATQQSYLHAISKFSQFFRRSPDHLGCEEVRAYQVHLVGRRVSWGALRGSGSLGTAAGSFDTLPTPLNRIVCF